MRRGFVAFIALSLVGVGLTGCGLFRFEQREPWRTQAEEACLAQHLVQSSAYMARTSKIDGPGACGMDYPFKVAAFSEGSVGLRSKVTLACPIIPRIDGWLEEYVKPAALLYFGVPVADLKAGSYSCRPRNGQTGAKTSEHAFGNAMDVMAFVLADGREVNVERGWRGSPAEQDFLREVFVGACQHFTTVLAPASDAFHYNHLHLDLARHDPRGERRICKPVLKFNPRIDPRHDTRPTRIAPGPSAELPPADWDEDPVQEEPIGAPYRTQPAGAAPFRPAPGMTYSADLPPSTAAPPGPPLRPGPQTYAPPVSSRPPVAPPILNGQGIY